MKRFFLYGAYGYTGKLIARYAADFGLVPVLAGRNRERLAAMADEMDREYWVVSLSDPAALDKALKDYSVVLHAAGPFIHTALPMMEACLRTGTHYLDITGEIDVFEMAFGLDEKARKAGVMLMPGTGFDVVPTDCLAVHLKNRLPDATHLKLVFVTQGGGPSHGTSKTTIENLGKSGAVRKDGKICEAPLGQKSIYIPSDDGRSLFAMSIPWGDVSTAYHSTGIPNIETYMGISPKVYRLIRFQHGLRGIFRQAWVKSFLMRQIDKRPAGPTDQERERGRTVVWGEVSRNGSDLRTSRLITPEGYTVTMQTSLLILSKLVRGEWMPGFQTPASAYGPDLIMEIKGVSRTDLQ